MTTAENFYAARTAWRSHAEEAGRFKAAAAIAEIGPGGNVIDLGARDGGLRFFLPRPVHYVGYDIAFGNHDVVRYDVTKGIPQIADTADAVFALDVLEHLPNPHAVLADCARVVKHGGEVIVSVPNPYHAKEIVWNLFGIADWQGHVCSWTPQTMKAMGASVGLMPTKCRGTYLIPGVPAPSLLSRSIVYRFVKDTTRKIGWLKSAIDGLRPGAF